MRILVFGDSIVRGSFDTECGGWVNRLSAIYNQKSIDEDKYCNTFNLGISGETATELLGRMLTETSLRLVGNKGETVIIIQSGINDSKYFIEEDQNLTYLGDFKQFYKDIIKEAQKHTEHVFCVGLTRVDESKTNPIPPSNRIAFRNKDIEDYETVVKGVAREFEATYVDVSDAVLSTSLCPDGIHPNSEGHQLIFERIKKVLEDENVL